GAGIRGNAIILTGGITTSLVSSSVAMQVTLAANQTFSGMLHIYGPLYPSGFTLRTDATEFDGPFYANGILIGAANFFGTTTTLTGPSRLVANSPGGIGVNGGTVNLNGFDLTLDGTVNSSVSGNVNGSGGIIKNGTGTWTLSGLNTYTGPTI